LVFNRNAGGPFERRIVVGYRQAAFVDAFLGGGVSGALGVVSYFGINENGDGAVFDGADEEDAQTGTDLRSGQANPLRILGFFQGLYHVFDDI